MKKFGQKIKNKAVAAAVVGSGNITAKLSVLFMHILLMGCLVSCGYSLVFNNRINVSRGRDPMKGTKTELEAPTTQSLSLLSFDLDDTFWSTKDVVRDANNKMIETMKENGCDDISVEKFLDTTRSIRKSLDGPITYKGLRKKTIRKIFESSASFKEIGTKEEDLNNIVDLCYDAWVQERHNAAERHLFPNAVETMETLRRMYPDTTFAAITNGAGCPLEMTSTLSPYFNFRVSGEDDGVFPHRKPHPYIYEYSIQKHIELQSTNEQASNLNGVWCHVGDCLANDVGASADCGAKTIWMCLEDNPDSAAARLTDARNTPKWSTATAEEIENRALQVQQGRAKVGATITSLAELPDAISKILQ